MEKKIDGNYTRILQAILNKSWRQHPTKQQLYGHLPPIIKTTKIRRTRHAGHCCRSRDELISDILQWTPLHGWVKAERPDQTYIQQLCEDTGCSPDYLPETMNERMEWRERVRDIRAGGTTRWWWFILRFIHFFTCFHTHIYTHTNFYIYYPSVLSSSSQSNAEANHPQSLLEEKNDIYPATLVDEVLIWGLNLKFSFSHAGCPLLFNCSSY